MRIVGGKYRSRLIYWPDDVSHIRPTKDRIREAIFSALGHIDGLNVCDLYAGSGAMGLEALSRGASYATFVDNNKIAIETTKKNISSLQVNNTQVIFDSDIHAIELFIKEKRIFDILFLDPPYKLGEYEKIMNLFLSNNLLNKNGIIVTESDRLIQFDSDLIVKRKDYHYGEVFVSIFWRKM